MESSPNNATAVTVNFMNGDNIVLELDPEETVASVQEKVATARNVSSPKVSLSAGTSVLPHHEAALTFGTDFTATIYNSLGVKWRSVMEPSGAAWAPLYDFAAVTYENRLLVIGGDPADCNRGSMCVSNGNCMWRTDGKDWERLEQAPWYPRRRLVACVDLSGRILIFGGVNRGAFYQDAWAYKDSEWKELPRVPWVKRIPDCATGTQNGAIVIAGECIYELATEWSELAMLPEGRRATSCAMLGDDLCIGTYDNCVLLFRAGHWSSVQLESPVRSAYSLVCAGPEDNFFIYLQTTEKNGAGTVLSCSKEDLAQNCGSAETMQVARAVVPRFADIREFHSRTCFLPLWGGLGILSCWGHLMHSE